MLTRQHPAPLSPAAPGESGAGPIAVDLGPVSKTYGANQVLHEARLTLRHGEVHALLGGNGSGKSTTIKILAGVEKADPGSSLVVGGTQRDLSSWTPAAAAAAGLRFIHQDLGLIPDLTVTENIFIGSGLGARGRTLVPWKALNRHAADVVERFGLGVSPTAMVSTLSLVQRVLLATARAMHDLDGSGGATLVLDEPTAALPPADADVLLQEIRRHADDGHAILIVTHRLVEVVNVSDRFTVLRQGHVAGEQRIGGASEADLAYLITGDRARSYERTTPPETSAEPRLRVTDLAGPGLDGVSFSLAPNEIVGLVEAGGRAGTGVLNTLFGRQPVDQGNVTMDGQELTRLTPRRAMAHGIAYIPGSRARDALLPGLSVGTNLTISRLSSLTRWGLLRPSRERAEVQALSTEFQIHPRDPLLDVTRLSGGNAQKVSVARWMRLDPTLLLLEEPTQGVDVGARHEIWSLISARVKAGASALVVSSDYQELAGNCSRIIVLSHGRVVRELTGDELTAATIAHAVQDA